LPRGANVEFFVMRKSLTIAVMACTALYGMTPTAAFAAVNVLGTIVADPANQDTLDEMQDQCDALADAHALADSQPNDIWTGEIVQPLPDATLVAGPTENGSHDINDALDGTIVGHGFHAGTTVFGQLTKTGGSPNLFADATAQGGYYDSSEYDFLGDFDTTWAHPFQCNIYESDFHGETQEIGYYIIDPDYNPGGSNEAIQAQCDAYNARGQRLPLPGYWGKSQGHCLYVPGNTIPEYWDDPELRFTENGTPVEQDQTDYDVLAHETAGEGFSVEEDVPLGRLVVCISPSNTQTGKKGNPGVWRPQNGYGGGSLTGEGTPPAEGCNTPYFTYAPWGAGTENSQTIYWSVPDLH